MPRYVLWVDDPENEVELEDQTDERWEGWGAVKELNRMSFARIMTALVSDQLFDDSIPIAYEVNE